MSDFLNWTAAIIGTALALFSIFIHLGQEMEAIDLRKECERLRRWNEFLQERLEGLSHPVAEKEG